MNTIRFSGKNWRLHSQTETKLTFVPADNPLAKWRKKNKWTQREAASRLGISQAQLARIESGTRTCAPELLREIERSSKTKVSD